MEAGKYIESYLKNVVRIVSGLDSKAMEKAVEIIKNVKEKNGRMLILGVGGAQETQVMP